jgi:hypothetical protein
LFGVKGKLGAEKKSAETFRLIGGVSTPPLTVKKKKYQRILLESENFQIDWGSLLHHSLLKKEVPQDTVRKCKLSD